MGLGRGSGALGVSEATWAGPGHPLQGARSLRHGSRAGPLCASESCPWEANAVTPDTLSGVRSLPSGASHSRPGALSTWQPGAIRRHPLYPAQRPHIQQLRTRRSPDLAPPVSALS